MKSKKFLTPTLEEYRALVRLKESGVKSLVVSFSGAGGNGSYDPIDFYGAPTVDRNGIAEDLEIVEKYLYRNLDARRDSSFSFDNEGCRGRIRIYLTEEPFEMILGTQVPVWEDDFVAHEELTPASEIEQLASEVT
jgi:hypothetical protein